MNVGTVLVSFLVAAGGGWIATRTLTGTWGPVVIYLSTFLAVLGISVAVRRWRG